MSFSPPENRKTQIKPSKFSREQTNIFTLLNRNHHYYRLYEECRKDFSWIVLSSYNNPLQLYPPSEERRECLYFKPNQ